MGIETFLTGIMRRRGWGSWPQSLLQWVDNSQEIYEKWRDMGAYQGTPADVTAPEVT